MNWFKNHTETIVIIGINIISTAILIYLFMRISPVAELKINLQTYHIKKEEK
jgi:hypothetical protein